MSLRDELQATLGNRYTLDCELDRGGMSRVFLATEVRLGRRVVVKVLAPELAEGLSAERFDREIMLAAKLQHPHIVPVLAAGETDGLPYYIMPFVEGQSLRKSVTPAGGLTLIEATGILRDVAKALAYAHGHGIVHRDIKPENILLTGGSAIVTDFGIAKAISASRTQPEASLTGVGGSLGTPAYMAPEQVSGDVVDHRADIYAFGLLAYEILSGVHVFSGRTSAQQLMAAHVTEHPAVLTQHRRDLPAPLVTLVMRCLEKRPEMRPQSATELLAALDAAGASSAVEHSLTAGSTRSRKRALVGGVAVVGLGLVALGAYLVVTSRLRMPRSVAVLPFEIVGPDTAFADGMADQLSAELTKVPGLNVVVRSSSYSLRHAGANAGHFGADAVITGSVQHDSATRRFRVTARLARVRDNSVLWSDNFTENAGDIFDVQDRMAQAITARVRSTLGPNAAGGSAGADQQRSARSGAGTRNAEANDLYVRGAYFVQRRGPWVQNAVSAFEQAIAKDPGFARAWAGLSEALSLLPYYVNVDPRPTFERAFAVAQHAVALEPNLAEARAVLGRAYAALYRNEEAAAEYRKAVAIDPMYAKGQLWYGQELVISGYPQAGFQATRRSAELDPYWFQPARQLSQVLLILGRHEEALIEARRAWQLDSTNSGVWRDLARVHFQSGRLDSAHVALDRMSQTPSPNTWAVILYLTARLGMPDSARRMMRRLEADSSTNRSFHAASLAFGYLGLGDTTRALDWLEHSAKRGEPVIFTLPLGSAEYDPIRSSARFAKVARAFGFDPAPLTGRAEASKR